MLYEIAHVIRDKFGFLWDIIEWGNSQMFCMMHRGELKRMEGILQGFSSEEYTLRESRREDVAAMERFFAAQPKEAFEFFQPHGFDAASLRKVVERRAFLTFVVLKGEEIVGYFFMRSFINNKTFKGYMVGIDQRGKGIARLMGLAMNRVAKELGLRMFKSISPENPASIAVTKKVNDIKIIKMLDNGDMLIECFEKAVGQPLNGGGISASS